MGSRSGVVKMSDIESEYQSRMQALEGKERVARAMVMLKWTREMLARQVVSEQGAVSEERLRWEVAARLYGLDDPVQQVIQKRLADVSG